MRAFCLAVLLAALVSPADALTKRQARRQCRKQIPDCVAALLVPTTTTLPVRVREVVDGSVSLAVEADRSLRVRVAPIGVNGQFVCDDRFAVWQGSRQAVVGGTDPCVPVPRFCGVVPSGAVVEIRLTCPAWLDVNEFFDFSWGPGLIRMY